VICAGKVSVLQKTGASARHRFVPQSIRGSDWRAHDLEASGGCDGAKSRPPGPPRPTFIACAQRGLAERERARLHVAARPIRSRRPVLAIARIASARFGEPQSRRHRQVLWQTRFLRSDDPERRHRCDCWSASRIASQLTDCRNV
jgi:hypothetical protein